MLSDDIDLEIRSIMNEEKQKDLDLPKEVMERINLGVVGVSLSMYDEGMSLVELAEVTGIKEENVKKCLNFLIEKRMVKQSSYSELYKVINFKKLLSLLVNLGLIFPISDFSKKQKKTKDV